MSIERSWDYSFPKPAGDFRNAEALVSPGYCPVITGVDGRFTGSLRRFPGMTQLVTVPSLVSSVDFFKYVEIQKGTSSFILRGFVVRAVFSYSGIPHTACIFYYYDTELNSWHFYTIDQDSSGEMDVASGGLNLYYVNEGGNGLTIFWNGSALATVPFGFTATPALVSTLSNSGINQPFIYETMTQEPDVRANLGTLTNLTALIPSAQHLVAYRLSDSRRNVTTPLQLYMTNSFDFSTLTVPQQTTFSYGLGFNITIPSGIVDDYDTIEVFRTTQNGGNLYREIYYNVPAVNGVPGQTLRNLKGQYLDTGGSPNVLADSAGSLGSGGGTVYIWLAFTPDPARWPTSFNINTPVGWTDSANNAQSIYTDSTKRSIFGFQFDPPLTQQLAYDADTEDPGSVPQATRIVYAGGITMVRAGLATSKFQIGDTWWSRTDVRAPETFPPNNIYRPAKLSDAPEVYALSGDYVFAVAPSRIYRFARMGASMTVNRTQNGYGVVSRWAAAEVGGDLMILAPNTLVAISGSTGDATTIGVIESMLQDPSKWALTRDSIYMVYDSAMSVLFIVNAALEEAVLVWGGTNTVTKLEDMGFILAASGTHPVTAGPDRAFFITDTGLIVYPNLDRVGQQTMIGTTGTVNGTVSARDVNDFQLRDDLATFNDTAIGGTLHILSGVSLGQSRKVTSTTSTRLGFAEALLLATGDRYSVSPVPYQVVGWPGQASDLPNSPKILSKRRVVVSVGANVVLRGGETDAELNPNLKMNLGVYKTTISNGEKATYELDMTEYPRSNFASNPVSGYIMMPSIRTLSSNVDFELISMVVRGSLETSDADQANPG